MEIVPMKAGRIERRRKFLDSMEKMDRGLSTFIQTGLTNTSYLKREQLPTPLPLSSDEVIIKKMKEFSSHLRANGVPKSWKAPNNWVTKESTPTGIKENNFFLKNEVLPSMPAVEAVNDSIDKETAGTPSSSFSERIQGKNVHHDNDKGDRQHSPIIEDNCDDFRLSGYLDMSQEKSFRKSNDSISNDTSIDKARVTSTPLAQNDGIDDPEMSISSNDHEYINNSLIKKGNTIKSKDTFTPKQKAAHF